MAEVEDKCAFDQMHTAVDGMVFMASVVCLLLHSPRKPSHRRLMQVVGWVGFITRMGHGVLIGLLGDQHVVHCARIHKNGPLHFAIIMVALFDQTAVLRYLPKPWNIAVRFVQALNFSSQALRVDGWQPHLSWGQMVWQYMVVWVLPQVFVFLPYHLIHWVTHARPARKPAAKQQQGKAAAVDLVEGVGMLGPLMQPAAHEVSAYSKPPTCLVGKGAATGSSDTPGVQGMVSAVGSMMSLHAQKNGRFRRSLLPRSWAGLETGPQPLQSYQSIVGCIQQTQVYKSRLGVAHKACLKLDTSTTCADLPPGLQHALGQALSSIQGPAVRITELAVRPGCVMITMGLVAEHPPSAAAAAAAAAGEAGSWQASQLAAALLPVTSQLLQLVPEQLPERREQDATKRAELQVDDQHFHITWCDQTATWQLRPAAAAAAGNSTTQPPPPPPPAPPASTQQQASLADAGLSLGAVSTEPAAAAGSTPWLGSASVTGLAASAGLAGGSSSSSTEQGRSGGWQLQAECQIWQLLDKLVEVEGWAPADHMQHHMPGRPAAAAAVSSGPLQLLVRSAATGAYLTTRVQWLQHHAPAAVDDPRLATAKVVVEVPAPGCLVQHHPGGPPSSLLLLTAELWQGHTLLSSSPLTAGPGLLSPSSHAVAPAAAGLLPCWWWGASSPAVSAAVAEVAAVSQGLSEEGRAAFTCLPSFTAFLTDLALWLLQVRQVARTQHHCASTCPTTTSAADSGSPKAKQAAAARTAGYMVALQDPASPLPVPLQQQLADGLLEYAQQVGLQGVRGMVAQQQRLLHRLQRKQPHSGQLVEGRAAPMLPVWLQPARWWEAVGGHPCALCESRYQQGLQALLVSCSVPLRGALALMGVAAVIRAVIAHDWSYAICAVPWAAGLTVFAYLGWRASARRGAEKPRRIGEAQPGSKHACWDLQLPLAVCIWVYRFTTTWLMVLRIIPASPTALVMPVYGLVCWGLVLAAIGLWEQLHASCCLPARTVTLIALLLDLPSALWKSVSEVSSQSVVSVAARCVVTPIALVGVRLAVEVWLRHGTLHAPATAAAASAHGRRAAQIMPSGTHVKEE